MKRVLTQPEERVIRLCHHDMGGHSIKEAASILHAGENCVETLLASAKKKAPQLFPILTRLQHTIIRLWRLGADEKVIIKNLDINANVLKKELKFLKKHKFIIRMPGVGPYYSSMDNHVKEKF